MAAIEPSSAPSLTSHVLEHASGSPKAKIFIGVVSACAVGSVVWYAFKGRKFKSKKKRREKSALKKVLKVAWEKRSASFVMTLALVPVGVCAQIYLTRRVHTNFGALATFVLQRDWEGAYLSLYDVGLVALPLVSLRAVHEFFGVGIANFIRTSVQRQFTQYYMEDADSETKKRVAGAMSSLGADCEVLGTKLSGMYCGAVMAFAQVIAKPVLLGMHMGWRDFGIYMTYEAVMRGGILRRLLPPLNLLAKRSQDAEGKLAVAAAHIATSSDEIQMIGGGGAVDTEVLETLSSEREARRLELAKEALWLNIFKTYLGSELGKVLASFALLPAVYYADIEKGTRSGQSPLMYLTNSVHDLVDLGKSLGLLFRQIAEMDIVSGVAQRVFTIKKAVDEAKEESLVEDNAATLTRLESKDGSVEIKGLSVPKPDGEGWLLQDVSFMVKEGDTFLIKGANGAGKTTLLRALTDRFKFSGIKGFMRIPSQKDSMFLPANNYFPPDSTISAHLAYPLHHDSEKKEGNKFTNAEMELALKALGLFERLGEAFQNNIVFNPRKELSDGEQRRLSLARVWLHKPEVAFLDEPLASIRGLEPYKKVLERAKTVVTVSHNMDKEFDGLHTNIMTLSKPC